METCAVVKVVADNKDGYIVINETDFNKAIHVLYVEKPAKK